jgi:hypothetical protein
VTRRDGDELVLLELPGHDVIRGLADRIDLAREAPERARIPIPDAELLCPTAYPDKCFIDEVPPSISDKVGDQKEVRNVSSYLPTNLGTHQNGRATISRCGRSRHARPRDSLLTAVG